YVRYRPSYPAAALELLQRRCGLAPGAVVADLGSGTGILTQRLLESGAQVIGVEPNEGMRAAAEQALAGNPRFRSLRGCAEATTLASASIDLLVAGQAFHWFDVAGARAEALRVLRPGAFAALLWNEHPSAGSAFLADYEALLRRHAPEYEQVLGSRADEVRMREFFGGPMERATFPHQQRFNYEGLRGRLMSSSYAPEAGDPQHEPLLAGLQGVFERHAHAGTVVFPYVTLVYFAQLQRGS
ncbi:MAG TPA: class I SAM-dependent methyltransferase, partial [Steroidobacteraceae bacterium]|nr:class I SAM-dependent methyltransferase [Steroidobacteraceae bacterium]